MRLLGLLNAVSRISTSNFIPKRRISEYAKRFGFKLKEPTAGVEINHVKNICYVLGSCFLLLDIARDKQQHYETYIKHFDEAKNYFDLDVHFSMASVPNMDFLTKDSNPPYLGDGEGRESFEIWRKFER